MKYKNNIHNLKITFKLQTAEQFLQKGEHFVAHNQVFASI